MYTPINGYTKAKILEIIESRPGNGPAVREDGETCTYKSPNGDKCAVGLFIPEGHQGQEHWGNARTLLTKFPDLEALMPLEPQGLGELQLAHDNESSGFRSGNKFGGNAKAAMIAWVNANVEG